jgi:hypothetical protein
MTGLAGAAMWLMMALMLIVMAAGGLTWTRRHLHRKPDHQAPAPTATPEQIPRHSHHSGHSDRDK